MSDDGEERPQQQRGRKRGRAKRVRSRAFTFTWNQNNDDEHEFVGVPVLRDFGDSARYLCYGHEVGESGNFHLQGYVAFDQAIGISTVVNAIPGAHVEIAKGNAIQNRVYCSKDDFDFYEEGAIPQQGRRNDLWDVKEVAKARRGISLRTAVEEFPAIVAKFPRFISTLNLVYSRPRTTAPIIIYFWGATGLGKSRTAYTLAQMLGSVYKVMQPKGSGVYFDGYDGHEVIWLDEFYGNRMSWGQLLEMTDRYPNRLPVHGMQGPENVAKYIIFTTNSKPTDLYQRINAAPFLRRISLIYEFKVPEPAVRRVRRETKANFYVSPLATTKAKHNVTKFIVKMHQPIVYDAVEQENQRLKAMRDSATYVDEEGRVRIRGG